jgi:glycine/D-amino acid oxidase-like deaminating enzyme
MVAVVPPPAHADCRRLNILVVGGGIMGLSAARSMIQAGHAVTLVERGRLPNPLASSIDHHRLIRFMYGDRHGYAAMVAEAYPAWERLWRDLGRIHYAPTGQLLSGPANDPWIAGSRCSLERLGIPFTSLDGAAVRKRFPLLDADHVDHALYSPTAGALFADSIAVDLVAWLAEAGARLCEQSRVSGIDAEKGTATLASGERLSADRVVVTTGVWTGALIPELAPELTPSRQVVVDVDPPHDLAIHWSSTTMLTDVLQGDQQSVFYAVPPLRGRPVKFGDHCFSKDGDPEADRRPEDHEIERVLNAARRRMRRIDDYRMIAARTCFYTLTEDERFLARQQDRLFVMAGFSGHGYKFAPLIGERLAAVVDGRLEFTAFREWLAGAEVPRQRQPQ